MIQKNSKDRDFIELATFVWKLMVKLIFILIITILQTIYFLLTIESVKSIAKHVLSAILCENTRIIQHCYYVQQLILENMIQNDIYCH